MDSRLADVTQASEASLLALSPDGEGGGAQKGKNASHIVQSLLHVCKKNKSGSRYLRGTTN